MDIQRLTQLSYHSCAQEKRKERHSQNQVDFIYCWLDINKTKVEICQEVLIDVSQNFEGTEEFIKQRIQEVCNRKKKCLSKR